MGIGDLLLSGLRSVPHALESHVPVAAPVGAGGCGRSHRQWSVARRQWSVAHRSKCCPSLKVLPIVNGVLPIVESVARRQWSVAHRQWSIPPVGGSLVLDVTPKPAVTPRREDQLRATAATSCVVNGKRAAAYRRSFIIRSVPHALEYHVPVAAPAGAGGCGRCGCSCECDSVGDRACFCDLCKEGGCLPVATGEDCPVTRLMRSDVADASAWLAASLAAGR